MVIAAETSCDVSLRVQERRETASVAVLLMQRGFYCGFFVHRAAEVGDMFTCNGRPTGSSKQKI
jgi:hypothetical protein